MTGQFSPHTLKFKSLLQELQVTVLIDTGSTHNILQPRIATHLNLPLQPILNFSVMVRNGSHIQCDGLCSEVHINLQGHTFGIPFYLFPIAGVDVVLGMEWLQSLGTIIAEFSIPSITFTYNNQEITLTGEPITPPLFASYHHIQHDLHTDSIASLHLLTYAPTQDSLPTASEPTTVSIDSLPPTTPPEVTNVLQAYPQIFQKPHGLPTSRPHDHKIPLNPNTPPINVKPYRYPHSQKDAMTSIIHDILKEGIIIPSNIPYSSPVLLVRKKMALGVFVWIIER